MIGWLRCVPVRFELHKYEVRITTQYVRARAKDFDETSIVSPRNVHVLMQCGQSTISRGRVEWLSSNIDSRGREYEIHFLIRSAVNP